MGWEPTAVPRSHPEVPRALGSCSALSEWLEQPESLMAGWGVASNLLEGPSKLPVGSGSSRAAEPLTPQGHKQAWVCMSQQGAAGQPCWTWEGMAATVSGQQWWVTSRVWVAASRTARGLPGYPLGLGLLRSQKMLESYVGPM